MEMLALLVIQDPEAGCLAVAEHDMLPEVIQIHYFDGLRIQEFGQFGRLGMWHAPCEGNGALANGVNLDAIRQTSELLDKLVPSMCLDSRAGLPIEDVERWLLSLRPINDLPVVGEKVDQFSAVAILQLHKRKLRRRGLSGRATSIE